MDFYKTINRATDYTITPFKSYANQRFEIVSGSQSSPEEITINRAEQFPNNWSVTVDLGVENDISGLNSHTLFASINHLYYSEYSLGRIPYSTSVVSSVTQYIPSQSCFVLNISQYAYGERVLPGTFRVDVNGSLYDVRDIETTVPGMGLLYVSSSNNIVGNIFYNEGIAVIKEDNTAVVAGTDPVQGIKITSGSTVVATFQSQITIYQHRIVCKMTGDELNTSILNPSTRLTFASSGSVANSGSSIRDLFVSGGLTPYQTTIGLYSAANELVAVAKLSTPIKRTKVTDQIFIIQFDSVI